MRFDVNGPQGPLYVDRSIPPNRIGSGESDGGVIVISSGFIAGQLPSHVGTHVEAEAERYSTSTGWVTYSFAPSGVGESAGVFTPDSWTADLAAVIAAVRKEHGGAPLVAFGCGVFGAVVPWFRLGRVAADGVVSVGTPLHALGADSYARLGELMVASGVRVRSGEFEDIVTSELSLYRRCGGVRVQEIAETEQASPWLIIHPTSGRSELEGALTPELLSSAGVEVHYFQGDLGSIAYDPRSMAVIVGWLERRY